MALPLDVLEKSVNQKLSLLLKDGRLIEGKLTGYDEYMNMVLEEVEETYEENKRRLGTIILRGNNAQWRKVLEIDADNAAALKNLSAVEP